MAEGLDKRAQGILVTRYCENCAACAFIRNTDPHAKEPELSCELKDVLRFCYICNHIGCSSWEDSEKYYDRLQQNATCENCIFCDYVKNPATTENPFTKKISARDFLHFCDTCLHLCCSDSKKKSTGSNTSSEPLSVDLASNEATQDTEYDMGKKSEHKSYLRNPFKYRRQARDEQDLMFDMSLSPNTDESGDQKQKPSSESSLVSSLEQVVGAHLNLYTDNTANDTDCDIEKLSDPSFDRLSPLAYERELAATRLNDTDNDIEQYSEPSYDTGSSSKYQRKSDDVLTQRSISSMSISFDESASKTSDNLEQGADEAVNKSLENLKQTAATSLNTAANKADNREESSKAILSRSPDEAINKTQDNLEETAAIRPTIAADEAIDNLKQDAATNSNIADDDRVTKNQDDQKQMAPITSSNIAADEVVNKTPKAQKAPAPVEDLPNKDDEGNPIMSNQTKLIYAVVLSLAIFAAFKYLSKNSQP